jgi:hypothetical protein
MITKFSVYTIHKKFCWVIIDYRHFQQLVCFIKLPDLLGEENPNRYDEPPPYRKVSGNLNTWDVGTPTRVSDVMKSQRHETPGPTQIIQINDMKRPVPP